MVKTIQPSLLAFDKSHIEAQIALCAQHGVKVIHYDVMDGVYVPNTAFETEYLDLLQKYGIKAAVHLMTKNVVERTKVYLAYPGVVESIVVHPYADLYVNVQTALHLINATGTIKGGIAIENTVDYDLYLIDLLRNSRLVVMMGVTPGAGGQPYQKKTTWKLQLLKKLIDEYCLDVSITLDGGVNFDVIAATKPYVDHYVIGTFLMNHPDFSAHYVALKTALGVE